MKVRRSSAVVTVISAFSYMLMTGSFGGGLSAVDAQAVPNPPAAPPPAAPAAPNPAAPVNPAAPPIALPPLTPPVTQTGEQAPPLAVAPPPALVPQPVPNLPPGAASPVPAAPLTLAQAIAIGLQHQPTVTLAQASVQSAQGRAQAAAAALRPSVSANSSYTFTHSSSPGFGGSSGSFGNTLSARQLVFDFNHTRDSVQASRDQEKASVADLASAREDTTFNIAQAYYTLLEDEGLVGVANQTVMAQTGHLAEARATYSAGKGAPVDVLMAQTNLADALLTLSTDQNMAAIARTNLDIAMGVDPRTPTQVVDVAPPSLTVPALNGLVTQALTKRPEVLAAQYAVAASEEDLKNARTNNLPAVVASGDIGARGNSFPGNNVDQSVGLSLQWDLFDSGLTSGLIKQAEASLLSSRTLLYQTQQTVSNDVTQAYLNVANAQQRVVTTNAEVANAQETLRLAEGQYRVGVGIFLAVQDDQAALALAQADQVNAIYALDISLAALNRAIGGGGI